MAKSEHPISAVQCRKELGIGRTMMSAIKRKMGLPLHARRVVKSDVARFMRENLGFKITDVYVPKEKGKGKSA